MIRHQDSDSRRPPPIGEHLQLIKEQLAILLGTNDLEPSSAMGSLNGVTAQSGIQEIVQRSEPTSSIEDEEAQYIEKEPAILRLFVKWCIAYNEGKHLVDDWQQFTQFTPDLNYSMVFSPPQVFSTETEKVNVIKARRDAGLDTLEDSLRLDNPNITNEQLQERIKRLQEEKDANIQRMQETGLAPKKPGEGDEGEEEDEETDEKKNVEE